MGISCEIEDEERPIHLVRAIANYHIIGAHELCPDLRRIRLRISMRAKITSEDRLGSLLNPDF